MQIVSHRVNDLVLYSLLLMTHLSISERARFVSLAALLFSLNRSLRSFFGLILAVVDWVIWLLLLWSIILVWFVHDHHVLIRSDPVHLLSISLQLLLISVCQVVGIVAVASILLPVLSHILFIHEHNVTVGVVNIREKVGAVWLKWYDLLVIEQRIFVEVRTIEALGLFIRDIVSCCLVDLLAWPRVVRSMMVHEIVRLLMIVLAIIDIRWGAWAVF